MILRLVLLPILYLLIVRALWRLIGGVVEGATGRAPDGVAARGVQMARDPVCGTFVVPSRAVVVSEGRTQLFFCSTLCRDKYLAQSSSTSGRADAASGSRVGGRTA
jgi:YHS domain-containing protein